MRYDRELLEVVLDGLRDGVIQLDDELRCIYANKAAAALVDRTTYAVAGLELKEMFPESIASPIAAAAERSLREAAPVRLTVSDPASGRHLVCTASPSRLGPALVLTEPEPDSPDAQRGSGSAGEVADLRNLGDALRISREQFRALADSTPQIVWIITTTGEVAYLNRFGREYFGLGDEERRMGWAPMVHSDDLPGIREKWRNALESGELFEAEFRLRRHDGTFRWHLGRALPVLNEQGGVAHWCGTSTDIHDLKTAHEDVEKRELLFRTMADAAPVMIWMSDRSKGFTYFNKVWLDFRGRSLDEERGFGWSEGVHPDDVDACLKIYTNAFEARETFRMEYRLRRADGAYRWVLNHGAPLFDPSAGFTGYIGSCIDIQERHQLEDQAQFLAKASPILNSSLDYESTLQSVADLMVPRMADWCAVDMLHADGSIKLLAVAHVDPDKVAFARELRERYPVQMDAPHGTANVIRTGESELYTEISEEMLVQSAQDEEHLEKVLRIGFRSAMVVPLRARGQILGAITLVWSESPRNYAQSDLKFAEELARRAAIVVDNARLYRQAQEARRELEALNETLEVRVERRTDELTEANRNLRQEVEERRRTEQALARANTQLEHRNRELQDFAYVASHDLQEPLRKILSFAGLLSSEYGSAFEEGGQPYLARIEDAADRMMGLIHDLLAYSRIATTGEAFRELDLGDVAHDVLNDLELRISETGGRVVIDELCTIEADPVQMRQLFQNLVGNALKFHREGVPPVVTIRSRIEDEQCIVEVRDNGIGFEEKFADRIFSPFQRLHSRGEYAGTGMGLAICRRIVERHDGGISVASRIGEGTTFTLRLPLRHPEYSISGAGSGDA